VSARTRTAPVNLGLWRRVLAELLGTVPAGISTTDHATPATVLAEIVATAGLVLVITGLARAGRDTPVFAAAKPFPAGALLAPRPGRREPGETGQ